MIFCWLFKGYLLKWYEALSEVVVFSLHRELRDSLLVKLASALFTVSQCLPQLCLFSLSLFSAMFPVPQTPSLLFLYLPTRCPQTFPPVPVTWLPLTVTPSRPVVTPFLPIPSPDLPRPPAHLFPSLVLVCRAWPPYTFPPRFSFPHIWILLVRAMVLDLHV